MRAVVVMEAWPIAFLNPPEDRRSAPAKQRQGPVAQLSEEKPSRFVNVESGDSRILSRSGPALSNRAGAMLLEERRHMDLCGLLYETVGVEGQGGRSRPRLQSGPESAR